MPMSKKVERASELHFRDSLNRSTTTSSAAVCLPVSCSVASDSRLMKAYYVATIAGVTLISGS
jgi:hypothetical protein